MLIMRANRTEPEIIDLVIHNVDADSVTTGMGVRWAGGAPGEIASADGVSALKVASDAVMPSFAGVALQDIPANDYGIIRAWGICNSVLLSAEANKTIAPVAIATSFLQVGAVAGSFTSTKAMQALSTNAYKSLMALNTTNISGGLNYGKVFVRAL